MPGPFSRSFQARRALLNHREHGQETIQRRRLPQYRPRVQQALFLTWMATHYVCAKRLLPSLPSLVALLEQHGHLCLTEEECRQLLAMSVSTAERYLRTQRKPRVHGLSTTTPGPWCKSQIPVRLFSQWEEERPGFVEMDLVAHCGEHLGGSFLYMICGPPSVWTRVYTRSSAIATVRLMRLTWLVGSN